MGFAPSPLQLTSPAFDGHSAIPRQHTGEGTNVSPALEWTNAPASTKSFAVFCHDPDAPLITPSGKYGYVHWVLYGIPGGVHALPEGTKSYTAGRNETGELGYTGPMPPKGHGTHHYFFWVVALDAIVDLPAGLTLWEMLEGIEPHVVGMNRLVGTYRRG